MHNKVILLIAILATSLHLQAQIDYELSPMRSELGEPVRVTLLVPKGYTAKDIERVQGSLEIIEIREAEDSTVLVVMPFDVGTQILPPLPFSNGNQTIFTDSISINVSWPATFKKDSTKIMEIKNIISEEDDWTDYWPLYVIVGLLLVVALIGYYYWQKRKYFSDEPEMPTITNLPRKSAREKALKKLDALEKEELWQKGEVKEYYSKLTFIIREFFKEELHIPATKFTSDQILARFKESGQSSEQHILLRELLESADLVKFAKDEPEAHFHQKCMAGARKLVGGTNDDALSTISKS